MSSTSFLKSILAGFAESLQPLQAAIASPDAFTGFLRQFGWTLAPADLTHVSGSLGNLSPLATNPSSLSVEQLATDLVSAGKVIRGISDSGAPAAFSSTFPRELLDYLVYSALAQQSAPLFALLHFVGVLNEQRVPAAADTGRAEYIERQVHWDRLGLLADQPLSTLEQTYGWGTNFDADSFLRSLGILLRGFGGHASIYIADRRLASQYYSRDSSGRAGARNLIISAPELETSVTSGSAAANVKLAFLVLPIPPRPDTAGAPDGLALMPVITGQASDSFAISDSVSLTLKGDFITRPVRAEIHPGQAVLRGSAGDSKVDASVRLDAKRAANSPWIAFGAADSSRLEVSATHASLGLTGQLDGDLDLSIEVGLDTAALVIDFSESDAFVRQTAGSGSSSSPFSFTLKWSYKSGFSISGNPSLSVTIPLNASIGPVTVQSIGLALGIDAGAVVLDGTAVLGASIGPVAATLSAVGFRIALTSASDSSNPGNLGNADLAFGFKPPSGVGLSVDAAGVTGGGFLAFETAKHEYSGVLQLQFTEFALQAFGIITTQVAGGSGYSLFALVDADFPPIPLGWGFTLNGVGGLFAIHRTANVDALRAALQAGQLASILFPKNAIANAPQILALLDALFPTAPGRFLFGPMALIGWGTPTVLTVALALILELPEPVRIILLARIALRLPSDSVPLVRINMDALGVLDLSQDLLSLDATLYDSKIMGYALTGDMALRVNWSGQREFLLAIGGFHPQFTPPTGFPTLKRITIDMPSGPVSKLRLAAYLAVSSNTVQFGAALDVFLGVAGFGLAGHLAFDALLQISPFHFDADISGSVALMAGGDNLMSVGLDATLSGPGPWSISGSFKVHIIFFDVHKSFSYTWGDGTPAQQIPAVNVLSLLSTAFADARNWGAALPDAVPKLVSLRSQDGSTVIAHPLAQLEAHQSVAPLDLQIERFGAAPLSPGASTFSITDFRLNGVSLMARTTPVLDDFAPAQFFSLSDTAKLAGPSFEQHDAGLRLASEAPNIAPGPQSKTIAYETFYIDEAGAAPRADAGAFQSSFSTGELTKVMYLGASARAEIRSAGKLRFQAPGKPISIAPQRFTVADTSTLASAGLTPAAGVTYTEAKALRAKALPAQRAQFQILAIHEMAAS
jgi:hypothetical protein